MASSIDSAQGSAGWLVVGRAHICSLARSAGRPGPDAFVGLTGFVAPALLGWGLRVSVPGVRDFLCAAAGVWVAGDFASALLHLIDAVSSL